MKRKILVTGGVGYIGSHTVVELIENKYEVVIIDNLSNSRIEVLDGIEKITGVKPAFENFNLCDLHKLRNYFINNPGIESVIHFAALKAIDESVEKPLEYYENNLVSLLNVLKAMKEFGINNLVFSSSCSVYGQPETLPVMETEPVKPANSPYGNTKQIAEEIIRDTINSGVSIRAVALRYFNPIGAHKSAQIGEIPLNTPFNLVPYITQTIIGKREHLRVFGDNFDTPDGTGIRDYIYVGDLAKAHVLAIERLLDKRNKLPFEVFNVGTGKGLSVFEIIKAFERATKKKVNYKIYPPRQGDIACVYADASLANRELGWKADTSIDDALLSAWNWELNINPSSGLKNI